MYVRKDAQKRARGKPKTYVSLAHNVTEEPRSGGPKRAKPIIFANLGPEDGLDMELVEDLSDAFERMVERRMAKDGSSMAEAAAAVASTRERLEKIAQSARLRAPELRILCQRAWGVRLVLEEVWRGLGLAEVLRVLGAGHRLAFDFERAVFGMVWNRLVDPKSKLACNEWLQEHAYFPEAEGWDVQVFYKALDLLDAHAERIEQAMMEALKARLGADELRLLLLDTTSTYFESDYDDRERAAVAEDWLRFYRGVGPKPRVPEPQVVNEPAMRLRGKSKDDRPGHPQVVVGLLCTRGGYPIRHRVYAGNRQDQTITQELLAGATEIGEGRPVVVADSGMSSEANLQAIDALPGAPDRITAVPLRKSKFGRERVLARPGRYRQHPTKEHFTMRTVTFTAAESPSGRPETWIATRNVKEAAKVERRLTVQVGRIQAVLAKDDRAEGHGKQVCDMLAKPALRRFVRTSADGHRLMVDQEQVAEERMLAGVKLLRTTLCDEAPETIVDAYQALLGVEDAFRVFKGPLRLRPMHHRRADRIRAHVLVCVLALLLLREVEVRTGRRWSEVAGLLEPVRAALVAQGRQRHWQRGEWSAEAVALLEALGVSQGPTTWGHHAPTTEDLS